MDLQLDLLLASYFYPIFFSFSKRFFLTSLFISRSGLFFISFLNAGLGLEDLISFLGHHGIILRRFFCDSLMSVLQNFLSIENKQST